MYRDYHEDYELRRYIWQNYSHALTERERALYHAAMLELKARHASSKSTAARLREMPGHFLNDAVEAVAESGLTAFQQLCCKRLLNDYRSEIHINRCERCHRIVASPDACACRWCGHHWYERRAELSAKAASSIYPAPK